MEIVHHSARAIQSERHRIGAYSQGEKVKEIGRDFLRGKWQREQVPILCQLVNNS